jgi:excisionase family DNA binding protein
MRGRRETKRESPLSIEQAIDLLADRLTQVEKRLDRIERDLPVLDGISESIKRLADHFAPEPADTGPVDCRGQFQRPGGWLSIGEAATRIGKSASGLRKLIQKNKIRFQQDGHGSPVLFRPEWLDEYLEATTRGPQERVAVPRKVSCRCKKPGPTDRWWEIMNIGKKK